MIQCQIIFFQFVPQVGLNFGFDKNHSMTVFQSTISHLKPKNKVTEIRSISHSRCEFIDWFAHDTRYLCSVKSIGNFLAGHPLHLQSHSMGLILRRSLFCSFHSMFSFVLFFFLSHPSIYFLTIFSLPNSSFAIVNIHSLQYTQAFYPKDLCTDNDNQYKAHQIRRLDVILKKPQNAQKRLIQKIHWNCLFCLYRYFVCHLLGLRWN